MLSHFLPSLLRATVVSVRLESSICEILIFIKLQREEKEVVEKPGVPSLQEESSWSRSNLQPTLLIALPTPLNFLFSLFLHETLS